jgi:hypothetical protein
MAFQLLGKNTGVKIVLLLLFIFSIFYFIGTKPASTDVKFTDIYLTKSLDRELLCWNSKCFQNTSVLSANDLNPRERKTVLKETKKQIFSLSNKLISIEEKFHNST